MLDITRLNTSVIPSIRTGGSIRSKETPQERVKGNEFHRKEHSMLETWQVMKLWERPCFSCLACLELGPRGCKIGSVFSWNPFWFVGTCLVRDDSGRYSGSRGCLCHVSLSGRDFSGERQIIMSSAGTGTESQNDLASVADTSVYFIVLILHVF